MTGHVKMTDMMRARILGMISAGAHPNVACIAAGFSPSYLRHARYLARRGNDACRVFLDDVEVAAGVAESNDVITTKRAASVEPAELVCPHCEKPFLGDVAALARSFGAPERGQRINSVAAHLAMRRLERRFPTRWSQEVAHTLEVEHGGLLDVARRVLAPAVFVLLLEELRAESGDADLQPF